MHLKSLFNFPTRFTFHNIVTQLLFKNCIETILKFSGSLMNFRNFALNVLVIFSLQNPFAKNKRMCKLYFAETKTRFVISFRSWKYDPICVINIMLHHAPERYSHQRKCEHYPIRTSCLLPPYICIIQATT